MTDAVLLGVYVVVAVAMAALSLEPPHVTPLGALIALTLCGVIVVTMRQRHPRAAFAGALVLALASAAVGSGAEGMLPIGAMYLVGLRARASVAWSMLAAALTAAAAAALALTQRGTRLPDILGLRPPIEARDSLLDWLNFFSLIAALLLIATLLGINAGHRRRQLRELQHRAEQLARERDQQAETARARERERIAREMHDVIAHSLTVMIAVSDGARLAADENPRQAKEAIGRVAETGRRTLGEVRRLLGTVRDGESGGTVEAARNTTREAGPQHAPQPDAGQLPMLVQEFADAGLPVRLTRTGQPPADAALGLTVYRIVQESLTNSLRHATDLQTVDVHVDWLEERVDIVVQDTSVSPSAPVIADAVGRGLLGMQERVALYNGTLEAGPQRLGWRVAARLQWDARERTES